MSAKKTKPAASRQPGEGRGRLAGQGESNLKPAGGGKYRRTASLAASPAGVREGGRERERGREAGFDLAALPAAPPRRDARALSFPKLRSPLGGARLTPARAADRPRAAASPPRGSAAAGRAGGEPAAPQVHAGLRGRKAVLT